MSDKHSDHVTHMDNSEDVVYLRSKHFPVNMRLFKTSIRYKKVVLDQCEYIKYLCLTKMDGYKLPHGMSSANAGLAFNIIGFTRNRGTTAANCVIMINPEILKYGGEVVKTQSNCGSLTLPQPIVIERYETIQVKYFDENGTEHVETFSRPESFTIQHEVDHNNGVLITDYVK